jgi:hypothetical protein
VNSRTEIDTGRLLFQYKRSRLHPVPKDKQDRKLAENILREEAERILAWMAEASACSRKMGSETAPHCSAAARRPLPRDTSSIVASLAGSSLPSAARHPPPAAACSVLAPELLPWLTLACSSLSAPSCPPIGAQLKGTFLSRTKGDIITEVQHVWKASSGKHEAGIIATRCCRRHAGVTTLNTDITSASHIPPLRQ